MKKHKIISIVLASLFVLIGVGRLYSNNEINVSTTSYGVNKPNATVNVDAGKGPVILRLPQIASFQNSDDQEYKIVIIKIDYSENGVVIYPELKNTVAGKDCLVLVHPNEMVTLRAKKNGTDWINF